MTSTMPRSVAVAASAILAITLLLVVMAVSAAAPDILELTKGPIPDDAVRNGEFNKALIPDFIPALDRNGDVAGYVARDLVISDGAPAEAPVPVFAADLKSLVGYMYPGRGFVPLGQSPDSVPLIPATVGGNAPPGE